MRWLLPFFLLAAGWWLEWGPGSRPGSGWGITLIGLAIAYLGIVGAAQVLGVSGRRPSDASWRNTLSSLLTAPGAFVVLAGMAIGGLVLGFGAGTQTPHESGDRDRQVGRCDRCRRR